MVFATGYSRGIGTGNDYATAGYDAVTGAMVWVSRYDGPGHGADLAYSIAVSPDGSKVFATGSSRGAGSGDDYATVSYDAATGHEQWVARYDGPASLFDHAQSVAVSPDGSSVFVTGDSSSIHAFAAFATVAYDGTSGAVVWTKRYNGPGNGYDDGREVAVSPDGSTVFVIGDSEGRSGGSDFATLAYEAATGARQWARRYNGPANGADTPLALVTNPDGSMVFVTGASVGPTSGDDFATIAYGATTGAHLWTTRYDGPGHDFDDAHSIVVSPSGSSVFVTGLSTGSTTGTDYATIAYDAARGARRWQARYDGPAHGADGGSAVRVSPDGATVMVTGGSIGLAGDDDYATLAYDAATGGTLWEARYDGPAAGGDHASSLVASPDGSTAIVTGYSAGVGSAGDDATVAYDT
jgi:WD40 repeat protein